MAQESVGWYRSLNSYFQERFGQRIRKIALSLPLTCPNRDGTKGTGGCVYCGDDGGGTGDARPIAEQLKDGISRLSQSGITGYMAYFQAFSNTYGPAGLIRSAWDEVRKYPVIRALSVGTRPDCVDEEKLAMLSSFVPEREVWIEYGLQSMHDRTLERIGRAHTREDFLRAIRLTSQYPVKICVHLILGLPDETPGDIMATARFVASLPIHGIKLHALYVEKGSRLASEYADKPFPLMSMEEYAGTAVSVLEVLPQSFVIQRLVSDCPADRLVAPGWLKDKSAVLARIQEIFREHGSWQGAHAGFEA